MAATMLVRSDGVRRIPVGRASGARRLWASGTLALRRAGQTQEPEEVAAHDLGLLFRRRAATTISACDCCHKLVPYELFQWVLSTQNRTRPEGVLWEMDVEEALAKLAK